MNGFEFHRVKACVLQKPIICPVGVCTSCTKYEGLCTSAGRKLKKGDIREREHWTAGLEQRIANSISPKTTQLPIFKLLKEIVGDEY